MIDRSQPGVPPSNKVRNVLMDRTPRPIDRDVAQVLCHSMGFSNMVFLSVETQSWGRTVDDGMGFTHCPENAQDHYWRLLCPNKQWYFQFVDYSPPMDRWFP